MSNINGTSESEILNGSSGADSVNGMAGSDTIYGFAGRDVLIAGTGDDILRGGDGNDTLQGGVGNDSMSGEEGADTLDGGVGNDYMRGGEGADSYILGSGGGQDLVEEWVGDWTELFQVSGRLFDGDEILSPEPGDYPPQVDMHDLAGLTAGQHYRVESVGSSMDTVLKIIDQVGNLKWANEFVAEAGQTYQVLVRGYNSGSGEYTLKVSEFVRDLGTDVVILSGVQSLDDVEIGRSQINFDDPNFYDLEIVTATGESMLVLSHFLGASVEEIQLADGTVLGIAEIHALVNRPTEDADYVEGVQAADSIRARGGDDTVSGFAGSDTLRGGTGDDMLFCGEDHAFGSEGGHDAFVGEGDDFLWGGGGRDVLAGYGSACELRGGAGHDWIHGASGADMLSGGRGGDKLKGWFGDDTLLGGDGGDRIFGQQSNDVIFGFGGNDKLRGGNGNDRINGGAGRDKLDGDNGADTFVFDNLSAADVIADFTQADGDTLFFRANLVHIESGVLAESRFALGGAAQTADQCFVYDAANGNLYYDADGSGGAGQIHVATFTNGVTLAAGDIVIG